MPSLLDCYCSRILRGRREARCSDGSTSGFGGFSSRIGLGLGSSLLGSVAVCGFLVLVLLCSFYIFIYSNLLAEIG